MDYETYSGRVARAIRILLAAKGISIADLAEGSGISLSTLKRRLLGASPFTIDEMGLVARYFDIGIAALIDPAKTAEAVA